MACFAGWMRSWQESSGAPSSRSFATLRETWRVFLYINRHRRGAAGGGGRRGAGGGGAGGAGAGLALGRMEVRGRAAVADDVRARARMRGENAVIHDEVDRGAGGDGRELLQELDRLEEQMRGAIAPDGSVRTHWRTGTCGSTSSTR